MLERIRKFCRGKARVESMDSYARGAALYQQGRYEQAAACLKSLRGRRDAMGQLARYYEGMSHRSIGIAHLTGGQFVPAEQHLRLAVELLGRQANLTAYLSSLYAHTGRYHDCASQMEKVSLTGDAAAANARRLAQAQWQAGHRDQAVLTITQAMRTLGPGAELHLQLGLFHAARENFTLAVESFSRAAQAKCASAHIHHWLGLAAAAAGNFRLSVRSLQRALQLRPVDVLLAYQLAMAARCAAEGGCRVPVQLPENLSMQPSATLAQQLARFVTREKEFVEAFLSLPESDVDGELFETLAGITQMALAQHEEYADMQYIVARVLERLGRLEAAAGHAARAVEINPRYANAHVLVANLTSRQGNKAQALEHLRQAIRCGADWPDVHCLAGELMLDAGAPSQAREHLRRALQLNPDYQRAAGALAAAAA